VTSADELISFPVGAGCTPKREGEGSLTLLNAGVEIRDTVSQHQGGYLLSSAERAEEPNGLMWAAELRYLGVMLARFLAVTLSSREAMVGARARNEVVIIPLEKGVCDATRS